MQTFADEIKRYPGGEKIMACMQCGTCSASCPSSYAMKYTPRKLITLIRANKREEVLSSLDIWKCASCYTCTTRCPRGIKFTEIMYILKNLAWKESKIDPQSQIASFYETFQGLIDANGRINEGELVIRYSFKTNVLKLLDFAPLGMKMFVKGRAKIIPSKTKGKQQLRELMELAEKEDEL